MGGRIATWMSEDTIGAGARPRSCHYFEFFPLACCDDDSDAGMVSRLFPEGAIRSQRSGVAKRERDIPPPPCFGCKLLVQVMQIVQRHLEIFQESRHDDIPS